MLTPSTSQAQAVPLPPTPASPAQSSATVPTIASNDRPPDYYSRHVPLPSHNIMERAVMKQLENKHWDELESKVLDVATEMVTYPEAWTQIGDFHRNLILHYMPELRQDQSPSPEGGAETSGAGPSGTTHNDAEPSEPANDPGPQEAAQFVQALESAHVVHALDFVYPDYKLVTYEEGIQLWM